MLNYNTWINVLLCHCLGTNSWAVKIVNKRRRCKSLKAGTQRDFCTYNFQVTAVSLIQKQHYVTLLFRCRHQGSNSFTDKNTQNFSRTFQDPWIIFQDLFVAHKCLNITKNIIYLQYSEYSPLQKLATHQHLSLIHIWRCRRIERCRSRWSPYH